MIVTFTGAQGVGKTTLLNKMKQDRLFTSFKFFDELTRQIQKQNFKINEEGDDETQRCVIQCHINNKKSNHEFKVLDRCIIDGFVYSKWLYDRKKITADVYRFAYDTFRTMFHLNDIVFYIKPEFDIEDDGVRSTSIQFRNEIADLFDWCINKYNIDVITLTGDIDNRYSIITENIRSKMYE